MHVARMIGGVACCAEEKGGAHNGPADGRALWGANNDPDPPGPLAVDCIGRGRSWWCLLSWRLLQEEADCLFPFLQDGAEVQYTRRNQSRDHGVGNPGSRGVFERNIKIALFSLQASFLGIFNLIKPG